MDPTFARLLIMGLAALAFGGVFYVILGFVFPEDKAEKRFNAIAKKGSMKDTSLAARLLEERKGNRRKQIEDALHKGNEAERGAKRRLSMEEKLTQAGLDVPVYNFWLFSLGLAALFAFIVFLLSQNIYLAALAAFVGGVGIPRFALNFLRKKRQKKFLLDLADAIDMMVRSLKTGLPVMDAVKLIANEMEDPLGPEFHEVVEGQKVGIALDQGIERMYARMPLSEVNYLAIVIGIQMKSGGNLSEALSNLSRVLRERKKMTAKIRSASQEAKSSAMIIGSLPFLLMAAISFFDPQYMAPLFYTTIGHIMLAGSAIWMTIGIFVMRQLINFDI